MRSINNYLRAFSLTSRPEKQGRFHTSVGARLGAVALALGAPFVLQAKAPNIPGTWTPLANLCPEDPETAMLLTDGTIFVKSYDTYAHNYKLTPTADGNYVKGTWSRLANAPVGEIYGPCQVLKDGRVFIAGGEYLDPGETDHNTCEVYDPVSNTWTQGPDGLFGDIGDTGNAMLDDGTILVSTRFSMACQIFDPTKMSWTATGTMTNFTGDEESWQTLADGTVMNIFNIGQRYFPTSGEWVTTAPMPANNNLVDAAAEIGPALMLYNGTILTLGGTNNTVFFTPPASLNEPGSWTVGPKIPNNMTCPDCPGAVEPNGKVIFISTPTDFGAATFNEYDPTTNTMSVIQGPPDTGWPSYTPRFLNLPNGQILLTGWGHQCYLYTPSSAPQTSWRAHLTSVTRNGNTFTLTGTQLNGLTWGGSYGDDASMATNYPIVMLKSNSTGAIYYAKSFNFSTMGVATGTKPVTCQFTTPNGMPAGVYTLTTSASGVASSNSLTLGLYIPPTAVGIYASQGSGATGGVSQISTLDQTYYTINSVYQPAGQVAAAQITFQIPTGATFASIGCLLNITAPSQTTSFIYLFNWKSGNYDLIGSQALGAAGQSVSADTANSTNYISSTGKVIVVNRVVGPSRLNAPGFTVKWDVASLTS